MKSRKGFISNSSSTSFVIDATKYPEEKVTSFIQKILEALNELTNTKITLNNICHIHTDNSVEQINKQIKEFYSHDDSVLHKGPVVIVDSVDDNSIPWTVQEVLESIALKRQHWG